ncbi:MAG: dephospho-CoA kinase [Fimbriimonadaceae bacterium]|nr:dephospho-CoA kinase [Fimbriimonadaceae bacterium]QYK55769.1 MAG: dephospho-CoA kinase [Fimbriimonadaceae bacterium]
MLDSLRRLGVSVGSADDIAARVLDDRVVQAEVAHALGETPPLDRNRLRALIAADVVRRRAVNRVLHPRIAAEIFASRASVVEIPLLIETALHEFFPRVWVVTCGPEEQERRLTARLGDPALARALMKTQLRTTAKVPFADVIIRTNSPLADVHSAVEHAAKACGLLQKRAL